MPEKDLIRIKDKRTGRFMIDDLIVDNYAKFLKAHTTVIYILLCRHANNETQQCYPSLTLFEENLGMDRHTVIKGIKKLIDYKLISKKVIPGRYTLYTILEPKKSVKKGSVKTHTSVKTHGGSVKTRREGTKRKELNNSGYVDNFVDKLSAWAYNRASTRPAISQDVFKKSVKLAIKKVGTEKVHDLYAEETNAIRFLTNLKKL